MKVVRDKPALRKYFQSFGLLKSGPSSMVTGMLKKSLFYLLIIAILYVCFQIFVRPLFTSQPLVNLAMSLIYFWLPGVVALSFAKKEGIALPVFRKPNKWLFWGLFLSFVVCLFSFLITFLMKGQLYLNPALQGKSVGGMITNSLVIFFSSYVLTGLFLCLIFLGGEIYWRGYLLEKLKGISLFGGVWLTAFLWSIWYVPLIVFTYSPGLPSVYMNVFWSFIFNFALSPLLTYFRLKGGSIVTSALFYSSLIASFLLFIVLFSISQGLVTDSYWIFMIVGLVILSLCLGLYSPKKWAALK